MSSKIGGILLKNLCNPIVILALIILSIANLLLSITIIMNNKKSNRTIEKSVTSVEEDNSNDLKNNSEISVKSEKINFTVFDTTRNIYSPIKDEKYSYNLSKEENIRNLCFRITTCDQLCSISCQDKECLFNIPHQDSLGNSTSPESKLFSEEIAKNISNKFAQQKEMTIDSFISESENDSGQIIMEFNELPQYIIMVDYNQQYAQEYHCYFIDDDFLNYINSLIA